MFTTLGMNILTAAIFDRDYRSIDECDHIIHELEQHCYFAHIHTRKEIENYLLNPKVIQRAIENRLLDIQKRSGVQKQFTTNIYTLFNDITTPMRHKIAAQFIEKRKPYEKDRDRSIADETITERLMNEFDCLWSNIEQRLKIIPGKETLASINTFLQTNYGISISSSQIISSFRIGEIDQDMIDLIDKIHSFTVFVIE